MTIDEGVIEKSVPILNGNSKNQKRNEHSRSDACHLDLDAKMITTFDDTY